MFTSAEAQELRVYASRYPIDDESNVWLPHGLLMAKMHGMMGAQEPKSAKDFMPFAKMEEESEPDSPPEPERPMSKKHAKRVRNHLASLATSGSW